MIDEVAFYTHPLPASRIAAHHAAITRPPLIRLFSASPRGIQPGDSTTLTWSLAEDVTALTIAPAIGDVLPWTTGGGGSVQASPEASTTYRLTASRGGEEQVVAASVVVGAGGPFRINEFLAINAGPVVDEDGEESDWIEIKNLGATPGNLGGWYLTDDPDNRARWRFPETILQPGRFVLVFASGKDRADPDASLHTNFKLKGSGEYLALVEPDGVTIHHQFAPRFPQQVAAVSYGLIPGGDTAGYFKNPTPLAENDADAVAGFVQEEVVADVTRGFFESPFEVGLSTGAVGAEIRFTHGWQ